MSCPPPTPALHRCELSWDEQAAAEPWSVRPRGQGQPGATRLEGSRDSSGQLKESHRVPQWAGKRPPHISRLSDPPTAFKAQHTPRPRGGRPGMPLATPQGPVQGSPHARPEAGTQPRPSALQPTGPPAACRGHGPRTPSPCSLAHAARPPPTPPCDDRRGGCPNCHSCLQSPPCRLEQGRLERAAHQPHTLRPRGPARDAHQGSVSSRGKPALKATRPRTVPQRAGAQGATREVGAAAAACGHTAAGGAGHQAPGSQRRAQQKCGCRTRGRVAPALRNGAGGKAGSRPRAPGCGFSVLPGPSRPLWAQPHPHGPIPAPAPSRPRTRAAAAHVGPATAGLTRLQLRLPARV